MTNLNLDDADDLAVSSITGDGVSAGGATGAFSLAEGASTTVALDVNASTRGGSASVVFKSNDFFGPEFSTPLGVGVAPSADVGTLALPDELRAGQVATATLQVRNLGDGNLSGLGAISNLNGSITSTGDGSVELDFVDSTFSLADGASLAVPVAFSSTAKGVHDISFEIAFDNGFNAANAGGSTTVSRSVDIFGPTPVIGWSDLEGEKSLFDPSETLTAIFDRSGQTLVFDLSNLQTIVHDFTNLEVLNVILDGPDAELFGLSGFTSGSILADSADQLMIHYSGFAEGDFATLTLSTDYLAEGGAGTLGQSFTINLVAVPEPGTTAFVCLAALAYAVFHGAHRRHKGIRENDENLGEVENAHTLAGDIE